MKTQSDYDQLADEVRRILLKRLQHATESRRFAIVVWSALIRDHKDHELLIEPD